MGGIKPHQRSAKGQVAFAPASGVCQGSGEPGAWGVSATELPTDYTYTGQREAAEIGLKYYVARWYDSEIGHFLQADTVVLSAGNPSAWNKYSYVSYNPFKYVDPTGHFEEYGPGPTRDLLQDLIERSFGVTFSGSWLIKELQIIHEALLTIKSSVDAFSSEYNLGITGLGWIRSNLNITFAHGSFTNDGKSNYVMKRIMWLVPSKANGKILGFDSQTVVHEFAHVFDNNMGYDRQIANGRNEDYLYDATIWGGGPADDFYKAMSIGGQYSPSGIRGCNGSCILSALHINLDGPLGTMIFIDEDNWMDNAPYSGYSSADYFAESFMFAIYGKELASDDQLKWMLENVFK